MTTWTERAELEARLLHRARIRQPGAGGGSGADDGQREPASPAQRRLFFLHRLDPTDRSYRITVALHLTGPVDPSAIDASVDTVVRRHPALRTVLRLAGDELVQEVRPAGAAYAVRHHEATGSPEQVLTRLIGAPFDLSEGPLFRGTLCRLAPDEHLLVYEVHHVVADAWSVSVLCDDLADAYTAAVTGTAANAEPLPLPGHGTPSDASLTYWRTHLSGAPDTIALPVDFEYPAVRRHRGERITQVLPRSVYESMSVLAARSGTTVAAVALATFATLLYRWTGDQDIVLGVPFAGRPEAHQQRMIGLFATTLPVRLTLDAELDFGAVVSRAREALLGALTHADLDFEALLGHTPRTSTARNPVYQVLFAMQNLPDPHLTFPGLRVRPVAVPTEGAKLELSVHVTPLPDGVRLVVEYDSDLFERATAQALADQLALGLARWPATPRAAVADLPMSHVDDEAALLRRAAGPTVHASGQRVVDRFVAWARRCPDRIALRQSGATMTYEQLLRRADGIAAALGRLAVGHDPPTVAVLLPRGFDLVAAVLAAHRARLAYLALDPRWPSERQAAILAGCRPVALITRGHHAPGGTTPVVDVDRIGSASAEGVDVAGDLDELAYIVSTSGSTGAPKFVMVTQRGLSHHLDWVADDLFGGGDGALLHSSIAFDLPVPILFGPLVTGQTLTLAAETAVDAVAGAAELSGTRFGFLKMTPSHLRALASEIGWAALAGSTRRLMVAGEELHGNALARLAEVAPELPMINEYGPSEISVASSIHPGPAAELARHARVPIGGPLPNTRVYVLDRRLRPVPPGVLGQIFIGGNGVGRGYLNDPRQTAERFRPDPYAPVAGARMYASGDRARVRPDGAVVFAGRADGQVKIGGVRVEPADVQATLLRHPGIREAAVLAVTADPARLRAVVVGEAHNTRPEDVTAWLRRRLPEQLVPAEVVVVDRLPLTGNGKLDRGALLRLPVDGAVRPSATGELPSSPTERALAQLWAHVLRGPLPAAGDDFFELGGHSMAAVALVERIRRAFGVEVPLSAVFHDRTLRELAGTIEWRVRERVAAMSPAEVEALSTEGGGDA
jgi:amino acid adenylation domain-containing protein